MALINLNVYVAAPFLSLAQDNPSVLFYSTKHFLRLFNPLLIQNILNQRRMVSLRVLSIYIIAVLQFNTLPCSNTIQEVHHTIQQV